MKRHLGDDINSTSFTALAFNRNLSQDRKSWVQCIMGQDPNVFTVNGARGKERGLCEWAEHVHGPA